MTYRERRERRAERLREWAGKREAKAEAAYSTHRQIADVIPVGQPVLVGHHSESRHRRDLERQDRALSKTVEHTRKAEDFRSRADNIEAAAERAVYSDDEDAVERLEERIAEMEDERKRIKSYNASCRKIKGDVGDLSILTEADKRDLLSCVKTGFAGEHGAFPKFKLSNLGGNINRNKKRLEALRRAA